MEKSNQTFTTGIWHVKMEKEKEFIEAWSEMAEWTFKKIDSGKGQLMRDTENPSIFVSVAQWSNEDVINDWRETDEFKKANLKINQLLVEPSQPHIMEVVASVGENVMV